MRLTVRLLYQILRDTVVIFGKNMDIHFSDEMLTEKFKTTADTSWPY